MFRFFATAELSPHVKFSFTVLTWPVLNQRELFFSLDLFIKDALFFKLLFNLWTLTHFFFSLSATWLSPFMFNWCWINEILETIYYEVSTRYFFFSSSYVLLFLKHVTLKSSGKVFPSTHHALNLHPPFCYTSEI